MTALEHPGAGNGQTCARCQRPQRFEFVLRHELWALVGEDWVHEALCIECWIDVMEGRLEEPMHLSLEDFLFMSVGDDKLGSILIHRSPKSQGGKKG